MMLFLFMGFVRHLAGLLLIIIHRLRILRRGSLRLASFLIVRLRTGGLLVRWLLLSSCLIHRRSLSRHITNPSPVPYKLTNWPTKPQQYSPQNPISFPHNTTWKSFKDATTKLSTKCCLATYLWSWSWLTGWGSKNCSLCSTSRLKCSLPRITGSRMFNNMLLTKYLDLTHVDVSLLHINSQNVRKLECSGNTLLRKHFHILYQFLTWMGDVWFATKSTRHRFVRVNARIIALAAR